MRLGDPVTSIETLGDKATGVVTASGRERKADTVACNGDVMHIYRDLLKSSRSAQRTQNRLERKRYSPSLFVVHFGIKGTWPGIPHHMILFGPRYKGLLADLYDSGVLPEDFSLYLHHPTVTRSEPGAGGAFDLLRAGAGAASRQVPGRLGGDRARSWRSASSTRSGDG